MRSFRALGTSSMFIASQRNAICSAWRMSRALSCSTVTTKFEKMYEERRHPSVLEHMTIKTADELSRIEATEESLAEHRRLAAHITALRIPAALQRRLAGISEATSSTAAPSGMLLDHSKGVALLTIGRLATERELVSLMGVAANALTALGAQLRCVLFSDLRRPVLRTRCSERTSSKLHAILGQLSELRVPMACTALELEPADLAASDVVAQIFESVHHRIVSSHALMRAGRATELVSQEAMVMDRLRAFGSWVYQQSAVGLRQMLDLVNFHRTERVDAYNEANRGAAHARARARLALTAGTREETFLLLHADLVEPERALQNPKERARQLSTLVYLHIIIGECPGLVAPA